MCAFEDNNDKVRFYTGLSSWKLFFTLFKFVESNLMLKSALTPFQQLMRLNLSGQDLAYQFKVHNSTISCIFLYVIDVLYRRLKLGLSDNTVLAIYHDNF